MVSYAYSNLRSVNHVDAILTSYSIHHVRIPHDDSYHCHPLLNIASVLSYPHGYRRGDARHQRAGVAHHPEKSDGRLREEQRGDQQVSRIDVESDVLSMIWR